MAYSFSIATVKEIVSCNKKKFSLKQLTLELTLLISLTKAALAQLNQFFHVN